MPPDHAKYHDAVEYSPMWYENRISSTIATKITLLRERIEAWSSKNGYENMDNINETRNDNGEIIWSRTDWEYVDDTYGLMMNDESFYPNKDCFKKMNVMWKKYK